MDLGAQQPTGEVKKVLIASANKLFGRGLEKLLQARSGKILLNIHLVSSMDTTLDALINWRPDLVILDYDDREIDRSSFLEKFVSDERSMQVVLVSLQTSEKMVIYDRQTYDLTQMEDDLLFFAPRGKESE
jgi:cytochrome c oxidase subunit 2